MSFLKTLLACSTALAQGTPADTSAPKALGEVTIKAAPQGDSGPLAAQPWSAAAVNAATASGRPVLVNLTADWCVTCKINERAALSSPRVAKAMREANAALLALGALPTPATAGCTAPDWA